jgi:hypothetical protein
MSSNNAQHVRLSPLSYTFSYDPYSKEKWDSSGANDAFGRVSASIPDSTRNYVGTLFNPEHLRSGSVYFGVGEQRPFYVLTTQSLLMTRLRHNVTFFYLNYMLLTAVLFCLTLLITPSAIIGIGLLALAWMFVIRASSTGSLQIPGTLCNVNSVFCDVNNPGFLLTVWILFSLLTTGVNIPNVPQKTATIGMAVLSVFVLLWLLSGIFWWALVSSGFLVAVHALLRDASMHKVLDDADDVDDMSDLEEPLQESSKSS